MGEINEQEVDMSADFKLIQDNEHMIQQTQIAIPVRPADGCALELSEIVAKWAVLGFHVAFLKDFMGGFIETTRQKMAYDFLHSSLKLKYLLMIDNDVVPPIELPFLLGRWDKGVVGGPCPIVIREHGPTVNFTIPDEKGEWRFPSFVNHAKIPAKGLLKVNHIGTGAMLVRRDVLESFTWEGEDIPFMVPQDYRQKGARTGTLSRGEDIHFCFQVREKGYDIYADLEACCGHKKQIVLTVPEDQRDPNLDPRSWRAKPEEYKVGK